MKDLTLFLPKYTLANNELNVTVATNLSNNHLVKGKQISNKEFDYLIYIGRFQPFHLGHKYIVERALQYSGKIIIICGSANQKKSFKNPCSYEEKMIQSSFTNQQLENLLFIDLDDYLEDEEWLKNIHYKVNKIVRQSSFNTTKAKIGIIGHEKDASSYYLKFFPSWNFINLENYHNISSTFIRENLFKKDPDFTQIENLVPQKVLQFLKAYTNTEEYHNIINKS